MSDYKPKGRPATNVLTNKQKSQLIEFIKKNPKVSYSEIHRKTEIPFSVAWYMCKKFKEEGIISINTVISNGRTKAEIEFIYK